MSAPRMRELSVYDGQELVGTVKVSKDGKARAFDRDGKRIGSFASFEAASAALNARIKKWRNSMERPHSDGARSK
jgi:hypothetical protein